jgi:hypothetical protein
VPGGGGSSIYPATATASFPYGFSAATAAFSVGNSTGVIIQNSNSGGDKLPLIVRNQAGGQTGISFQSSVTSAGSSIDTWGQYLVVPQNIGSPGNEYSFLRFNGISESALTTLMLVQGGTSASLPIVQFPLGTRLALQGTDGTSNLIKGLPSGILALEPDGSGIGGTSHVVRLTSGDESFPIVLEFEKDSSTTSISSDGLSFTIPDPTKFNSNLTLSNLRPGVLHTVATSSNVAIALVSLFC